MQTITNKIRKIWNRRQIRFSRPKLSKHRFYTWNWQKVTQLVMGYHYANAILISGWYTVSCVSRDSLYTDQIKITSPITWSGHFHLWYTEETGFSNWPIRTNLGWSSVWVNLPWIACMYKIVVVSQSFFFSRLNCPSSAQKLNGNFFIVDSFSVVHRVK